MRTSVYMALCCALSIVTFPVAADGIANTEAQKTIKGQIDALRKGDGSGAYSYAAPSIRSYFPTVESFMRMVEGGYSPVLQPQDLQFGRTEALGPDVVMQEVELIAKDGTAWIALYSLARQPDGTWKITGVQLLKTDGGSA